MAARATGLPRARETSPEERAVATAGATRALLAADGGCARAGPTATRPGGRRWSRRRATARAAARGRGDGPRRWDSVSCCGVGYPSTGCSGWRAARSVGRRACLSTCGTCSAESAMARVRRSGLTRRRCCRGWRRSCRSAPMLTRARAGTTRRWRGSCGWLRGSWARRAARCLEGRLRTRGVVDGGAAGQWHAAGARAWRARGDTLSEAEESAAILLLLHLLEMSIIIAGNTMASVNQCSLSYLLSTYLLNDTRFDLGEWRQLLKCTPAWLKCASSRMKSSWSILLARDSAKPVAACSGSEEGWAHLEGALGPAARAFRGAGALLGEQAARWALKGSRAGRWGGCHRGVGAPVGWGGNHGGAPFPAYCAPAHRPPSPSPLTARR